MFINYEDYATYPVFSEDDIEKHMLHLCFKGFVIGHKPGTLISIIEVHVFADEAGHDDFVKAKCLKPKVNKDGIVHHFSHDGVAMLQYFRNNPR